MPHAVHFDVSFSDKVCVITGATEGIGRALAVALGRRGAALALCGRNRDKLDSTASALRSDGVARVVATVCDVSREEQVAGFRETIHDRLGPADILINNAGLAHFRPLTELTTDQIDETFAVNVRGVFLVTRAFLPDMLERGAGDIVNMASLAGRVGVANGTAYSASKHAVLGFSRSLMLEVRKRGVRVIAVCPGSVETPFFEKAGSVPHNLDRVLKPSDVADAVVAALGLPARALVSELDVRPSDP